MRLHRLEITAFGPFSGTEVIDFDALSDAGLFLIQGQTGAGKTSVLDAISFALYGQVPGARNAVKRLRSDHAPADRAPQVTLEVTIRGRRFRISRSPAWERPKLRGSGTTEAKAEVLVAELPPGAAPGEELSLSTRLDEAGDLITGLLGMSATQFCQVAMLPQGEFAAFLKAGADQRRKVLEKLFGTEVFTQVEGWLADRRAAAAREAQGLWAAVESTGDRIAEVARTDRPPAAVPGSDDDPITAGDPGVSGEPWAAELAGQLVAVRDETERLLAGAVTACATARTAAERGRELADRQARHADARRRAAGLEGHAEERARLTDLLEAAARADRVLPLIRAVVDRERREQAATGEAVTARTRVAALVPAQAPGDVLDKAERERRVQIAGLEQLRHDAVRLDEVTTAIGRLDTERVSLAGQEAACADAVAELPGRVETLRSELETTRIRAAGRAGAQAAVSDAARRLDAAQRRDRLIVEVTAAEDQHRQAVDAAQQARDRLQRIRQARLDGMAAELAQGLTPAAPCPVCGSCEHPAAASAMAPEPDGAVPSDLAEREAEAEERDDRAQRAREAAAVRLEGLRADRDAAYDQAGETPVGELADALAQAERTVAEIDAAAADAERCEAELLRCDAELTGARELLDALRRSLTGLATRLAEQADERDRLGARLAQACGDDPTIEARIRRLTDEADALAAAAQASQRAETAAEELAAARASAEAAAGDEGFGSADQVLAAALSEDERTGSRRRLRALDDEEATVLALIADPALAAAAAEPEPDMAALEARLAEAEAMASALRSAFDRARQRCDRLAELRAELTERVARWRPAAERHAIAHRLAGITAGRPSVNRLSMPLSSYVLAARLEQVVAAANQRLGRMSAGRFALVHTIDKGAVDGRRRSATGGLGLRVVDAWTGQERDPVTLSGGESFIASLALALGLADVVTIEAGGTEINTLFVDEGFGTLDDETLDEVMDVLDALRDGGRAVGIVSHVAELRTRVPAQLRISKHRAGSRASIVV